MNEVGRLTPIEVVMLLKALTMKWFGCSIAFEQKAGHPFPSCFIFSLLKKFNFLNTWLKNHFTVFNVAQMYTEYCYWGLMKLKVRQ